MSFTRVQKYLSNTWSKYFAAEDPDQAAARIRKQRIDNIMLDVIAREAMLNWELRRFSDIEDDRTDRTSGKTFLLP